MELVTKDEAVKNWPTWSDGTPVSIGEVAMSLRGPRTILGVEVDGSGYTLWGRMDDFGVECNPLYIIDQGTSGSSHPVREGEPCDFWSDDAKSTTENEDDDVQSVANMIKRIARVYGRTTEYVARRVTKLL